MKHDALFSELRSLTQRPASSETWAAITDLARGVQGDDYRRFADELVPYLDAALTSWPDELRVADDLNDPLPVRLIARTLRFDEDSGSPRYTQAIIKTHSHHLWRAELCAQITRVEILSVRKNLGRLFHALMRDLSGLEAVFVRGHFETRPDRALTAKGIPSTADAFVDLAVDLHGPTLTSFGLQETWEEGRGKSASTRRLWRALFARLDDLPNLRALHIRQDVELAATLEAALSDPRLDALEELHVVGYTRKLDTSLFTDRSASRNLRRVRVCPISEDDSMALVSSPNLSGVTCWELHESDSTDTDTWGWGSARSDLWASRSPYIELSTDDLLDTAWIDLSRLERDAIHERLFDASGDLRASANARGIALGRPFYKDLRALFAHAHVAMPGLRELVFHPRFVLRPSDVRALSAAPLIDRLDALWIPTGTITVADPYSGGHPSRVAENRRAWFALSDDDTLHPALRLHAWRCGTEGGALADLRSMCRALDVPNTTRADRDELVDHVARHAPDVFDDPRSLLLDAPVSPELDPNGVVAFRRANDTALF